MAYVDYLHCAVCDCKTLYDAECDYESASGNDGSLHDIATLCKECSKTHSIKIDPTPSVIRVSCFLD